MIFYKQVLFNMQGFNSELAHPIKLVIFDVDGVFTDGKLYFNEQGEAMKAFNSLDGLGIKMLMNSGIEVAIITGRTSKIMEKRANELGISHLYQGNHNKLTAFSHCLQKLKLTAKVCAYMGDDVSDLPIMQQVHLGIAPPNAVTEVKQHADWITSATGGNGAVREICDAILKAQNKWQQAIKAYEC